MKKLTAILNADISDQMVVNIVSIFKCSPVVAFSEI